MRSRLPLTTTRILEWGDEFHARTGAWPKSTSGPIETVPDETWQKVDVALREGLRGLPGGSSLARLLEARRGVRNRSALPALTVERIEAWARAHFGRNGAWPTDRSGTVPESPGETWSAIDGALWQGKRGLPGRSSLPRLLRDRCGVRHGSEPPRLERWEILVWADAFRERTGRWPIASSGPIPEAPGETWSIVDSALLEGSRGLPGGDSLARLLARRRGKRNTSELTPLSVRQILRWADDHRARTGDWPTEHSGPVSGAPDETWRALESALRNGRRGLPAGSSLARALEAHRGVRNEGNLPPLTPDGILKWADDHRTRTGRWPKSVSGPVAAAPGETWLAVATAFSKGGRGLPGGDTLARFLARHRGARNHLDLPRLTRRQILAWADRHRERAGSWPAASSGSIPDTPDTWRSVARALRDGLRGLPGGDSLARLLGRARGRRNRRSPPPLTPTRIRRWIRDHRRRTGSWPTAADGPIPGSGGETWMALESALRNGNRSLPGGSSLAGFVRTLRK